MDREGKEKAKKKIKEWRSNNPEKNFHINRRARLKRKYGMTAEDYDTMYTNQNGCCAICSKKKDKLCIDHCHKSNKVRGLLCHNCNTLLGHIENLEKMEKVNEYLTTF